MNKKSGIDKKFRNQIKFQPNLEQSSGVEMKILYVDYYNEYGKSSRGLNYIGIDGFMRALVEIGNYVEAFYFDEHLADLDKLNQALIEKHSEMQPEMVFFNLYTKYVSIKTLDLLKDRSVTVNWFGDDTFLFDSFSKDYATHFTYCITTDKYSVNRYIKLGQKNVILSQWPAFSSNPQQDLVCNYTYDISFVGAKNPPREWFIERLRKYGLTITTFGNGWPTGPISGEKMQEVFRQSKINLNISNSDSWDIRFLFSKYCSLAIKLKAIGRYLIKKSKIAKVLIRKIRKGADISVTYYGKTASQIKARNFEIPCSGGFQLTDYVPSIEDYFVIGKEIACYSNVDEAEKLIRHYLEESAIRESIRDAGFIKANKEYTYEKAIRKIFEQIEINQQQKNKYDNK